MLKIFGIIALLGSLLLLVVGVGGAVMNFVFRRRTWSAEWPRRI